MFVFYKKVWNGPETPPPCGKFPHFLFFFFWGLPLQCLKEKNLEILKIPRKIFGKDKYFKSFIFKQFFIFTSCIVQFLFVYLISTTYDPTRAAAILGKVDRIKLHGGNTVGRWNWK